MWRVLAWLRRRRFAVVFDLQGYAAQPDHDAGFRCTPAYRGAARLRLHRYRAGRWCSTIHAFDRLNALLAAQGIDAADPQGWLSVPEAAATRVQDWLDEHGQVASKLVLMHAGSSNHWQSKRWEVAHYAELAAVLERRGCTVVWVGADTDAAVNRQLAGHAGIDASGAFSLVQLAALGGRASFAVVNDSAPMHVLGGRRVASVCVVRADGLASQPRPRGRSSMSLHHAVDL